MIFHPDARLRPKTVSLDLRYDGSIGLQVYADVLDPGGKESQFAHVHVFRVGEDHAAHSALCALLREAVDSHHDALGLSGVTEEHLPHHLRSKE